MLVILQSYFAGLLLMLHIRLKPFALALLLVLSAWSCGAQGKQGKAWLDSLLSEVPRMADDTPAVKLLVDISFGYCISDPAEGLRFAGRALSLAQKIGWRKGEALAYNDVGSNYLNQAAYPQAMDYFFRALRIHEELGDKLYAGKVETNIGAVYYGQKNYQKALEHYIKGLKAAQETDNKIGELAAASNVGNAYYAQGAYREALTYMQQALRIAQALNDKRGIINQLGNIGNVYASLLDNQAALDYYFKALRLAMQENDRQLVAANEGNIGELYLDIAKDTARKLTPAGKTANLTNAVDYLQKGITSARAVQFNAAVIELLGALSEAYTLQDNYQAALKAQMQYTALKDSTFSLENNATIAGLETRRAVELKDKDIQIARLEVARKRNERWFFIAGIALLLAIMGILFRSFRRQQHSNILLSGEKKRSDDLLLNILPAEVAEELKETGSAQARQYEQVSVLFTDFVDFTGTAQDMSPQALVTELHECFTAFDAITGRNGLEKIKTVGDAYMAVCGLPVSDPLHAAKTVQAALEIRDFIAERRKKGFAFEIRIGINSGTVVAGIVGVKKFAYDIWGDTVNTAARMEQHGAPGAINISHTTHELVKDDYRCEYRGKIAAKHKGEIEMYFVEAPVRQRA